MADVFVSTLAHQLQDTLETIVMDDTDGIESKQVFKQYMDIEDMDGAFEDEMEFAGTGLAAEKAEGAAIMTGSVKEGPVTRYIARTFALGLNITEEALEDGKYKQTIKAAKHLKLSLYLTMEQDAANILVRATTTGYNGGDGVTLANTAHPLPQGGTFSNMLSTAMSPSRAAIILATSQIKKFPGHNGLVQYGNMPMQVVCPTEQWAVWDVLMKSEYAPEAGEFNAINVVNGLFKGSPKVVPSQFWSNTTTKWCIKTDAEDGLKWKWRRKPRNRSWVDNDNQVMKYSIDARWTRGWTDPRTILFSDA